MQQREARLRNGYGFLHWLGIETPVDSCRQVDIESAKRALLNLEDQRQNLLEEAERSVGQRETAFLMEYGKLPVNEWAAHKALHHMRSNRTAFLLHYSNLASRELSS